MKWNEHTLRWLKQQPRIAEARNSMARIYREWRKFGCPTGRAAAMRLFWMRKENAFWPNIYLPLLIT